MRLAIANALIAVVALICARELSATRFDAVRLAAQLQFMHSMATIACATFMNVGAKGARRAPALFLSGSLSYAIIIYLRAVVDLGIPGIELASFIAMISGWIVLVCAARDVDHESDS